MIRRIPAPTSLSGKAATRYTLFGVILVSSAAYFVLFSSYDASLRQTNVLAQETTPQSIPRTPTSTRSVSSQETETKQIPHADADADCIFRDSKIYRKVFVYPSPNEPEWQKSTMLTEYGRTLSNTTWPWLEIDATAKATAQAHYNINSQNVQYASELLIREIIVNPKSCLRTYDPEQADLFYVPYLPSTEHHVGHDRKLDYSTSPYGKAILEILDNQNYEPWETTFGLTSTYWKRRGGSDHILVFSEPMHGLFHPRSKRGHYHFIHSQKQLTPPIVFSVELSTAFVTQYPNCARKNILLPYPNTHGGWFNGDFPNSSNRTISQYYSAGNHGTCTKLRRAMKADYTSCSPSFRQLKEQDAMANAVGMRKTIFCPCPGGDSPSAKRMFDSLIAGCIPVIISKDFVWPFTKEFDENLDLDPSQFSIRLQASDFDTPLLDPTTCDPVDAQKPGLQAYLDNIPPDQVRKLQEGAAAAGKLFSWYKESPDLPLNPLQKGILPDGGTAHFVVRSLEERAAGKLWHACRDELEAMPEQRDEPRKFQC